MNVSERRVNAIKLLFGMSFVDLRGIKWFALKIGQNISCFWRI